MSLKLLKLYKMFFSLIGSKDENENEIILIWNIDFKNKLFTNFDNVHQ